MYNKLRDYLLACMSGRQRARAAACAAHMSFTEHGYLGLYLTTIIVQHKQEVLAKRGGIVFFVRVLREMRLV